MENNLLILGAGMYGRIAKEIAESMNCFDKISFADDVGENSPVADLIVGKIDDIKELSKEYGSMVVAIGNCDVRWELLERIENETSSQMVNLISPRAFISPYAEIGNGCIIEPMAVVNTEAVVGDGCIISAGAVVNHACTISRVCHIDCNATVRGNSTVPQKTKVCSGVVFE